MKTLTVKQIKEIDHRTINSYGLPALILMEHAGKAAAEAARDLLPQPGGNTAVICGPGNNGGDGFVCARWLNRFGPAVEIFTLGPKNKMSLESQLNLNIAENIGLKIAEVTEDNWARLSRQLFRFDLIIDALLGTGSHGEITGLYKLIIDSANESGVNILSIDLPSGLNADTGEIFGSCIKAKVTVTLGFPKAGFSQNQGAAHAGKVIVADIGLIQPPGAT